MADCGPRPRLSCRRLVLSASAAALGLLAGCGRLPLQSAPPTPAKVYRVGYVSGSDPATGAPLLDVFRQALGALGYLEGQNLALEARWGYGSDVRLTEPVTDLVRLPADVIVVTSGAVLSIAREATTTVPVVLAGLGDPVAAGFAASYARPGGNVTGVTSISDQLAGKRLQLLKESAPSISRVGVFWDATMPGAQFDPERYYAEARTLGLQVVPMPLYDPAELEAAFEAAGQPGVDGLIRGPGPLIQTYRQQIGQLAARYRWPAMYDRREFVKEGGLMAYAANQAALYQRAAALVDKILRGTSPAEIPIEQPTTFDFLVNMKAARALGLTFSPDVSFQITEVIDG